MSIGTEITRISQAKSDIIAAIASKGVTVIDGTKIDGLADLIASIVTNPFDAYAKISKYKIVTTDYTGTATASGEKVMLHENLGWTPHLTLSLLVSDPNEAYPVAPDGYVAFTGVLDMRHWNPLNTKIVMFSFARTGQETKWWVTRADMAATDSDSAWYQGRWTDQRCIIGRFHGTGYALHANTRWLTLMLRFDEPTVTLTAPTGLTVNGAESASGDSLTLSWNRSAISGGEGIVYLIYRDGTRISSVIDTFADDAPGTLSLSDASTAVSGAYTVRAYNSYAGLSEPSNAVTFTYQA